MNSDSPLRTFFERKLGALDDASLPLETAETPSTEQVVSHLVERTVRRAALDAATHRPVSGRTSDEAGTVSWKHCLMVAALTELRPVKLLARR